MREFLTIRCKCPTHGEYNTIACNDSGRLMGNWHWIYDCGCKDKGWINASSVNVCPDACLLVCNEQPEP